MQERQCLLWNRALGYRSFLHGGVVLTPTSNIKLLAMCQGPFLVTWRVKDKYTICDLDDGGSKEGGPGTGGKSKFTPVPCEDQFPPF